MSLPYLTIEDFRLGMDTQSPRVVGKAGSLWKLKNGHITRGGRIQRSKKFAPKFLLPQDASACNGTTQAFASFQLTAGTNGDTISSLKVGTTELLGQSVSFTTSLSATATAIAAEINANKSAGLTHGWTAVVVGPTLTIKAPNHGTDFNSLAVVPTFTGTMTATKDSFFSDLTCLIPFDTDGEDIIAEIQPSTEENVSYGAGLADVTGGVTNGGLFYDQNKWQTGGANFTVDVRLALRTDIGSSGFSRSLLSGGTAKRTCGLIWRESDGAVCASIGDNAHPTFALTAPANDGARCAVVISSGPATLNVQNLYTLEKEGTTARFYKDGVLVATETIASVSDETSEDLDLGTTTFEGPARAIYDWVRSTNAARYNGNNFNAEQDFTTSEDDVSGLVTQGGCVGISTTFGLHALGDNLWTFGGKAEPAGMPAGVNYMRLNHADQPGVIEISKILDSDNFDGKIYVIAEFTDGNVYHYFNGSRVVAWDGIASSIADNDGVAAALKSKIDQDSAYDATVTTNEVTITAATAGVPFTISSSAQNFGSINDQTITLAEVTPNSTTATEVLATGSMTVTGGTANTAATGSFDVATGGGGDTITSIKAGDSGGTELLGSTVNWTTSDDATAALVRDEINNNTSAGLTHGYSATAAGATVTVTAPQADGADTNALSFTESVTGNVTIINKVAFSGGVTNAITDITVDGVSIVAARVNHTGTDSGTATAIASAINSHTSSPDYDASASGNVVTITADAGSGDGPNGFIVDFSKVGDATASTTNMSGGQDGTTAQKQQWTATVGGTFEAADQFTITLDGKDYTVSGSSVGTGKTCLTFKQKMYATALSILQFSALNNPEQFGSGIGSGFLNVSNQDGGSQSLVGAGIYQGNLALFSKDAIQIEFVDVDEEQNVHLQTLRNSGAFAHRSIVEFANDLFYLDENGIRSIRARQGTDTASVDDVGTAIDTHVQSWLESVTDAEKQDAIGIIEPTDKRYWIAIKNRIYVFSFFPAAKISAWSYYEPGFDIDAMAVADRRLYVRDGDLIRLYGGDDNDTYPAAGETPIEVELPFHDMDKPCHQKTLGAYDQAALNDWTIEVLTDPNDESVKTGSFSVLNTTYPGARVGGVNARSSHHALNLSCAKAGNAELYSLAMHFHLDESD